MALAAAGVLVALVAAWFLLREPVGPPAEQRIPMAAGAPGGATTSTTTPEALVVHAAGALQAPGVYRLPPGSRVADVVNAAGGPAPDADLERVNLAAPLADGSQVHVPRVGEPAPVPVGGSGGGAGGATTTGPLDLNAATLAQLEELPGVGPATAQAIVEERERRGRFGSVEELLDVRGIGPAKLDGIRDLVTV